MDGVVKVYLRNIGHDPMLTTIAQPKCDLGSTAMDLLLKRIRGEIKEPQDICLEFELVIRESTIR